ncbi:MAG: prepilin-type N-terminal cleavage/methylation domain-containing protein [Sedimentisphaerales bacterium]|nr:prepilin-type N-terminal cleavage/methylation domain-containing protein [Sedimentisphaerales bacterium]
MCKNKGFTLIELLVVISIIALLISILMPALKIAREQASGAVCLSNQRSLITAWLMYAHDNKDCLMGGSAYYGTDAPFVLQPLNENGSPVDAANVDLASRIRGIEAGKLYPYLNTHEVFHCPGDRRWNRRPPPLDTYRSYSIIGTMYGEDYDYDSDGYGFWLNPVVAYTKLSQIKSPSEKIVFLEEDPLGQFNIYGSWVMDYRLPIETSIWRDAVAVWHNKKSTLSFVDGHAEMHDWVDPRTIELAENGFKEDVGYYSSANNVNEDLMYLARAYGGVRKR